MTDTWTRFLMATAHPIILDAWSFWVSLTRHTKALPCTALVCGRKAIVIINARRWQNCKFEGRIYVLHAHHGAIVCRLSVLDMASYPQPNGAEYWMMVMSRAGRKRALISSLGTQNVFAVLWGTETRLLAKVLEQGRHGQAW